MTETISKTYNAPPTIRRFMLNSAPVRVIMGPVGSGKSTACIIEIVRRCKQQRPGKDGKRKSRWCVVRNTAQQLKDTTFKTWCEWVPPGAAGTWKESEKTFLLKFDDVEAEILFRPLDTPDDIQRVLSLDLTGAWFNECREIPLDLVDAMQGRVGRYPSAGDDTHTFDGIICDTNPPDEDSDWHKYMTRDKPANVECFYQPSGLSPQAENKENLKKGYYENLVIGKSANWIDVYVHGRFGIGLSGKPIYKDIFDHRRHVVPRLLHIPKSTLVIGHDFGLNPAALIMQPVPVGMMFQLRILMEITAFDMDMERFVQTRLRPRLITEFPGCTNIVIGDPSGLNRSGLNSDTSFKLLKRNGFKVRKAETNLLEPRIGAVNHYLTQNLGDQPMMIIDGSRCPLLVEGYKGKYRYRKRSKTEYADEPEKNEWSHVHDANQYGCLYIKGGKFMADRLADQREEFGDNNDPQANYSPQVWS